MFERSHRWTVTVGVALVLTATGLWVGAPVLLVAAMAPLGFVAYSALTSAPPVESALTCQRTVTPGRTAPGNRVTVTLSVTNRSDALVSDVRLVDGVPDELAVVDGTPRAGVTLRSGETTRVTYTLRARYGTFEFAPVTVQTRSLSADSTYTATLTPAGDATLQATYDPETYPLASQTLPLAGAIPADHGSEGLEFHGIRSYEPGDPASRINWRQYARERVLSTIEYRQEEAAEVLVVVDARPAAAVASSDTAPTAIDRCVALADDLIDSLLADRNRVGVLALGVEDAPLASEPRSDEGTALAWVPPANTRRVRTRMRQLLDAAAATVQPGRDHATRDHTDPPPVELIDRLNRRTQIMLLSPLHDAYPVELTRQLTATGHAVTVFTPAITARTTPGGQLTTAQRHLRIAELTAQDTTVIDWDPTDAPDTAFERHTPTRGPTDE